MPQPQPATTSRLGTAAAASKTTTTTVKAVATTNVGKTSECTWPRDPPGAGIGTRAVKGTPHTGGEGEDGGTAGEEQKEVPSAEGQEEGHREQKVSQQHRLSKQQELSNLITIIIVKLGANANAELYTISYTFSYKLQYLYFNM